MAKKQKVELTPEEKAAKKLRHSNGWGTFLGNSSGSCSYGRHLRTCKQNRRQGVGSNGYGNCFGLINRLIKLFVGLIIGFFIELFIGRFRFFFEQRVGFCR